MDILLTTNGVKYFMVTQLASASMSDKCYYEMITLISVAANKVFKITIAKSNISSTADDDAIKAFTIVDDR